MSILVDRNTKVLVQGITGKEGAFHAARCKEYGTQVVGGVTPAGVEVRKYTLERTSPDASTVDPKLVATLPVAAGGAVPLGGR